MPTSASGSYSLPTLRFQNSKPGTGNATSIGASLFNTLNDMATGIRQARIQGGGGGGGTGSISTGQIASFTACVGDVLATAVVAGDGLTVSAGTHSIEVKISAVATSMIPSFTACVQDAAFAGLVAGNGITISSSGHVREIKTGTLTVGQFLSFTANVGQAANAGLLAGTAIVLSFNATTNVTEIRASITSGGGISSFTACVGDAMFPNLKAGTNVAYSFNAGTHQTEINVTGSLGAISSLTASVHEMVTEQSGIRYIQDYGAVGDGTPHPLSETYASLTAAIVDYPYATALTDQKDYLALLTALYDAPAGPFDSGDMVHVHCRAGEYFWGAHTFSPTRCVRLTGESTMEGNCATYFVKYPVGHGIHVNSLNAQGSWFEGFEMNHGFADAGAGYTGFSNGVIRERDPVSGLAIVGGGDESTTMTSSSTFETRRLLSMGDTIVATFYCTGVKNPFGVPDRAAEITIDPSAFTLGETVTWTGGSAQVAYIGQRVKALLFTVPTGSAPAVGTTITGGTSGAVAIITSWRTNNLDTRVVVELSGTVDDLTTAFDDDDYIVYCRQGQFGHGILLNQRAYCHNVRVNKVNGNGIYIAAGGGGYSGNANLSRITRPLVANSGGNGVAIAGADANVVTVAEGTMTENRGYAVMDNSFLGAIVYGNHTSSGAIGSFYFGGGNSISFGNYTEGNQDKIPFKRKISRVLSGHLDMCGTTGTDTLVYSGGCRITNDLFQSDWLWHGNDGLGVSIRNTGSADGGISSGGSPVLRVQNGGNRGSGLGCALEMGVPWDLADHYGGASSVAYPAMRMTSAENGGIGRCDVQFKTMRGLGSVAVRARAGGSFLGEIRVASAGTITSVYVHATGDKSCTLSDTLSISNPGAGAGAILKPVIRRGQIEEVYVQSGGSGYTNTFSFQTSVSMRDDYLQLHSNVAGQWGILKVEGVDADINIGIVPKGTGYVYVPKVNVAGVCNITTSTSLTASSDLILTPSGAGRVRFGEFTTTATTMLVTGYIEIRDAAGNIRKLAVVG